MIELFKRHSSGKIGYWKASADENGKVTFEHASEFHAAPVTREYQATPKNVGKKNETSAYEQAVKEINSRAKKKLDEGYVRTIEETAEGVTNSLGLKRPMLATPIEKVKITDDHFEKHWCYVQPKLDGHRALWCPESKTLYSRQGKKIHMPHIEQELRETLVGDYPLDGELYLHGVPLQDLSRLIKKYREGESNLVQFHVYDLVNTEPFNKRAAFMRVLTPGESIRFVNTECVSNMDDVMNLHASYRKAGYEGTMLRISGNGYEDGKRSRALLKIKEFHDDEFLITGVVKGKETTLNGRTLTPAVWICRTKEGKEFNVLAQGDALAKHEQFIDRHRFIGKQLTVKYHYLSKDGVPQLPIALRFKEDI